MGAAGGSDRCGFRGQTARRERHYLVGHARNRAAENAGPGDRNSERGLQARRRSPERHPAKTASDEFSPEQRASQQRRDSGSQKPHGSGNARTSSLSRLTLKGLGQWHSPQVKSPTSQTA